MSPAALTDFLHRNIPLTAAMGLRAVHCGLGEVEIAAPLTENLNHRGTAFGGSLATLGIVSAWALLHMELHREKLKPRLVIQKSECDFAAPVDTDFFSASKVPEKELRQFIDTLRRRGRARITIDTRIHCGDVAAVQHRGTYVALT